jgi:hypothetical protein
MSIQVITDMTEHYQIGLHGFINTRTHTHAHTRTYVCTCTHISPPMYSY